MSNLRYSAKRDENEKEIIEAFEKSGCVVARLNGDGIPDLLVSYRGFQQVVEVKTKKGRLTKSQLEFEKKFGFITVISSAEEAIEHAKKMKSFSSYLYEAMTNKQDV